MPNNKFLWSQKNKFLNKAIYLLFINKYILFCGINLNINNDVKKKQFCI